MLLGSQTDDGSNLLQVAGSAAFTQSLTISNNYGLSGKLSGGTAYNMIKVDASDNLAIGSGTTSYGNILFYPGGAEAMRITNGAVVTFGSSRDVGLARNAAGVLEINNGTAGSFADLKAKNGKFSGDVYVSGGNGVSSFSLGDFSAANYEGISLVSSSDRQRI
ncbi:MAG: hypothetical protein EBU82_05025, partial [Flavobacteriia bacterium]|nr:hypothetical protein [Flavobacteriia bacterium]